jgi:hypothetical protein
MPPSCRTDRRKVSDLRTDLPGRSGLRGPHTPALPSPREGARLLQARRALAADPARALAFVHAHQQEFPSSQLRPERERIAAEARQRLKK